MLTSKYYIPILKWKRAELRALKLLGESDKKQIAPIIELVMPTVAPYKDAKNKIKRTDDERIAEMILKFRDERIKKIPEEILEAWGKNKIFVDFTLLYTTPLKIESMDKIISNGYDLGLKIVPVVNLNDEKVIKEIVCLLSKKYNSGLCLRITKSDLSDTDILNKKINEFLRDFYLIRDNVDLLVDVKEIQENGSHYSKLIDSSQNITEIKEWRNFIFASGSFPQDLSKCKLDELTPIPRFDWMNWKNYFESKKLKRTPIFSDYTIRNPIFNEALQYFNSTKSIKYTIENEWIILKGRVDEFADYLTNAKLLVESSGYFYGENFSPGDKGIADKARHYSAYIKDRSLKGTGRSEDWIAMGINHHLILVTNQIASLS